MKINSASAAIVHSLIIQATVMASHPNSLTQVSANQSPSAYLNPTRYKSTLSRQEEGRVFIGWISQNHIIIFVTVIVD
jgi:hypothetical protein